MSVFSNDQSSNEKSNGQNGSSVPWANQSWSTGERVTTRARQVVQDLPAWDPLPPGEMIVRRPQHY